MTKPLLHALLAGAGIALSLCLLHLASQLAGAPLLIAPFGASAALLFGLPDSPLSKPKRVLGGYAIAMLVGMPAIMLLGYNLYVAALATGVVVTLMLVLNLFHAPVAGLPILLVLQKVSWSFVLFPLLAGLLLLLSLAIGFRYLRSHHPHSKV
jgi:CBS-domain-containing membrane protein